MALLLLASIFVSWTCLCHTVGIACVPRRESRHPDAIVSARVYIYVIEPDAELLHETKRRRGRLNDLSIQWMPPGDEHLGGGREWPEYGGEGMETARCCPTDIYMWLERVQLALDLVSSTGFDMVLAQERAGQGSPSFPWGKLSLAKENTQ